MIGKEKLNKEKLTKNQIEVLAHVIRSYLIQKKLWQDVTIYFNGKAFSTSDGSHFAYNNPKDLIVLENKDQKQITKYAGDILTMVFEGPLYDCMNFTGEYGYEFESQVEDDLRKIFAKYGCYYELGEAWNLTLYYI